jgi:hypothetical protein
MLFLLLILLITTDAHGQVQRSYPDTLVPHRLRNAVITQSAFVAGGLSVLYANWYADRDRVPFQFYNDSKGYNQVDKAGHAFGAYAYSTVGYRMLRHAGVRKGPALLWGGGLGMYFQTPIEVFDGLYEGWGFSWSDMAANAFGTGLLVGQEALFDEQIVQLKFSYWRSPYADDANGYLGDSFGESLLLDYNGHTYWLTTGLDKLTPKLNTPPWLNVAVGYGAGGMLGEFANRSFYRGVRLPELERYRRLTLSLDINWSKVPASGPFLRALLDALNFVKVPFPGVEWNTKGQMQLRALAF